MVGSGRNNKSMVILERSFGGDKKEKMNRGGQSQGGGDGKRGNRFDPLNNDIDNPEIDDFDRAIRLSLMEQERGKIKIFKLTICVFVLQYAKIVQHSNFGVRMVKAQKDFTNLEALSLFLPVKRLLVMCGKAEALISCSGAFFVQLIKPTYLLSNGAHARVKAVSSLSETI